MAKHMGTVSYMAISVVRQGAAPLSLFCEIPHTWTPLRNNGCSCAERDYSSCEFCGKEHGGQLHLATSCPEFQDAGTNRMWPMGSKPIPFTKCTGIPCRTRESEPILQGTFGHSPTRPGQALVFAEGSASPPELPQARFSFCLVQL